MSATKTQRERILAVAGRSQGVCRVDFQLPNIIDGGPPILNFPGRMFELDREGHSFEVIGKRSKCKVWRLLDCTAAPSAPPPTGLFEVGAPEMGAYEFELRGEAA